MRLGWGIVAALLGLSGCAQQNSYDWGDPTTEFVRHAQPAPLAVLLPVKNCTSVSYPWGIEKELTQGLVEHIAAGRKVAVATKGQNFERPLSAKDAARLRQAFPDAHYVIAADLVGYNALKFARGRLKPALSHGAPPSGILELKMRVTIIDLRPTTPCPALQEIVVCEHPLTGPIGPSPGKQLPSPENSTYLSTPVGAAHQHLEQLVAERIENYVLIANGFR